MTPQKNVDGHKPGGNAYRRAIARGLGIVLPPLLTIVIFLWIGGTVDQYVLSPLMDGAEAVLVRWKADIRPADQLPPALAAQTNPVLDGVAYQRLAGGEFVPKDVYDAAIRNLGEEPLPRTGAQAYRHYFRAVVLRPYYVVPAFVLVFAVLLYLLGRFMAGGIGRLFWSPIEGGIERVPLVRNVYSAVKQVSGFILNERDVRVSRVVAVEYPRPGVWALAFVMGEAMPEIEAITGEKCLTVLVCTSPMPMAGFTITIRRSEVVDLNITLDQAIQFIVSCGVVLPPPKNGRPAAPVRAKHPAPPCLTNEP